MENPSTRSVFVFVLLSLILMLALAGVSARQTSSTNQTPVTQDAKPFDQDATLAELRKKIAGQENKPAEEVWKNIQILKGRTAVQVLGIMNIGYSKSLGVNCTHCHVVGQWEKDEKPTKQIARDMWAMMRGINNEYLKNIKNLKSATPAINCTTCHRGQIKPALNL